MITQPISQPELQIKVQDNRQNPVENQFQIKSQTNNINPNISHQIIENSNNNQNSNINSLEIKQEQNQNLSQIEIKLKCIGQNITSQLCISKKCQNSDPFLCSKYQCKCNQNHQICQKGHIKAILKRIQKKINPKMNQKNILISDIFKNIIKKINQFQEEFVKKMNQKIQLQKLTTLQKQFYDKFNDNKQNLQNKQIKLNQLKSEITESLPNIIQKVQKPVQIHPSIQQSQIKVQQPPQTQQIQTPLTGIKLSSLWLQIDSQKNKQSQLQKEQNDPYLQVIKKLESNILNQLQKSKNSFQSVLQTGKSSQVDFSIILEKSSILKQKSQLLNLEAFFVPKKIKSINLLFKASQNQFDIKKFYQKCGIIRDTIILCQTDKGKIIGGYTPLKYYSGESKFVADYISSSFIFSLSNNEKFQLKNNQRALYRDMNKTNICFGNAQLYIHNKANTKTWNQTSLTQGAYTHMGYKNDKEGYLKLNGNQSQNFIAKEWEVYKIQFEQISANSQNND